MWLGEYADIRNTYDHQDPDDQQRAQREATQFYLANQEEMDKGCDISWEHCYSEEGEISAIQHAYNMLIDDGADVFASECQNEPIIDDDADDLVTADVISEKVNKYARRVVPADTSHITAFIDVQKKLLYYTVVAWSKNFTGWVLDYGTYPDQKRRYFTLREAKKSMLSVHRGGGFESALQSSLTAFRLIMKNTSYIHSINHENTSYIHPINHENTLYIHSINHENTSYIHSINHEEYVQHSFN